MTMLLPTLAITAAIAKTRGPIWFFYKNPPTNLALQANFVYGSGGTTADAYVQTSFDGGATWVDIANFHFTTSSGIRLYNLSSLTPVTSIATPTSGSLTANTAIDGIIGDQLSVLYVTTGTYGGATTLRVDGFGQRMTQ